jgi:hypothetical protein
VEAQGPLGMRRGAGLVIGGQTGQRSLEMVRGRALGGLSQAQVGTATRAGGRARQAGPA